MIEHDSYYKIRNHLLDFLVRRSKELQGQNITPNQIVDFSKNNTPTIHAASV